MTRKDAVEILGMVSAHGIAKGAKDTAVRSLEAWDKVLDELNEYGSIWVQYKIIDKSEKGIEKLIEDVLRQAKGQTIDIIKKHLSEVEE